MSSLTSVPSLNHLPEQPLVPGSASYSQRCHSITQKLDWGESRNEARGTEKEASAHHYPGLFFSLQICDFETGYPAADGMRRRLPGHSLVEHTHIMRTHAECALIPYRRLICSGYRPGTEQKLEVFRQLCCLPPAHRIKGGGRGTGDTLLRQNDKEAFVFILPNQTEPCLSLHPVGTFFAWSPGAYTLNIF